VALGQIPSLERDISCDVGREALAELNAYYRKMTDAETGDRLFERTMWYCSADDGWVVKGASAAELYGIATEKQLNHCSPFCCYCLLSGYIISNHVPSFSLQLLLE